MNQFASVVDCQIIDASLIVNEPIDLYYRNKTKCVVIKLDLEKVLDLVDWEFLYNIMIVKGFGNMEKMDFGLFIIGKYFHHYKWKA